MTRLGLCARELAKPLSKATCFNLSFVHAFAARTVAEHQCLPGTTTGPHITGTFHFLINGADFENVHSPLIPDDSLKV